MSKLPSRAQVKFAKIIADKLKIDLPQKNTAYEYWKFIHDNREKFDKLQRESAVDFYEENIPSGWFC